MKTGDPYLWEANMSKTTAAFLICLTILVVPTNVWSKGEAAKIEITADSLGSPIEITDPDIIRKFNIWNGPGVGTSSHGVPNPPAYLDPNKIGGRFIDWPKGTVEHLPDDLKGYDVKFHIAGRRSQGDIVGTYIVVYSFNPSFPHGFMYLPDVQDGAANTSFIYHGVEGAWFYSSAAWENLVPPIIDAANKESVY